LCKLHGLLGGAQAAGRYRKQGLVRKLHHLLGKQHIARKHRTDIVFSGNILGGDHVNNAWCGSYGGQIQRPNYSRRSINAASGDVQGVGRQGHVIYIVRCAGDMAVG